jgi:osmoprotectant transport system ATP-binding protein
VLVDGQDTGQFDVIELRRKIGYVIQQVGLFPHMTVEENIGVVPRLLGWPVDKRRQRALDLSQWSASIPARTQAATRESCRAGQAQRIGVARALAADPPILLMDEPFGALDPLSREALQDEFLTMQSRLKKTIIFVSHDIDEAFKMADRIAIFRQGRIARQGTPDALLAAGRRSLHRKLHRPRPCAEAVAPAALRGGAGTVQPRISGRLAASRVAG